MTVRRWRIRCCPDAGRALRWAHTACLCAVHDHGVCTAPEPNDLQTEGPLQWARKGRILFSMTGGLFCCVASVVASSGQCMAAIHRVLLSEPKLSPKSAFTSNSGPKSNSNEQNVSEGSIAANQPPFPLTSAALRILPVCRVQIWRK